MHILMVAIGFPSPNNPYPGNFIGEQVRILSKHVERITVLSPVPRVPMFLSTVPRFSIMASIPARYDMVANRCQVLFPRYLKAPGDLLFAWTTVQWRRIIAKTVAELSKTHPVSLIHANTGSVSAWSAIQVAKRHKIPSVVTYQGSEVHTTLLHRQKGWKLCREAFRLADLNISVSGSLEGILKEQVTPQGRCEVLLRGVDQMKFFPSKEGVKKPIVLFVGRISASKGVFDLLDAWQQVVLACPYAELWMVGPDHTNGNFLRQVRSRGYEGCIKCTGSLPSHDVATLMRTAQALCLPSHAEGMPNCVMEALASGLPVVATRVGGIPEIIDNGKSGILVDKGDVRSLAVGLMSVLLDSQCRKAIGEAGHDFALRHLDARKSVMRLVEWYGELINGNCSDQVKQFSNRPEVPGHLNGRQSCSCSARS